MVDIIDSKWTEEDNGNTSPAPNGVQGGYLPNSIAPIIRSIKGGVKRWYVRQNAIYTSTGSANAYALEYDVSPQGYQKGENFAFWVNHTNTSSATLNINSLGAKNVVRADGTPLVPGQLGAGTVAVVQYDGTVFRLLSNAVGFVGSTTTATTYNRQTLGINLVDNTPDLDKPISTATQTALDTKASIAETYNKTAVDSLIAGAVPAGAVMPFARSIAPVGWLVADGAAYSRIAYATLFAAIGTTFGAGDGSTTFNVPDLRAEFIRGWDKGRGVDAGRTFGSIQASQNLSHTHGVNDPGHYHGFTAIQRQGTDGIIDARSNSADWRDADQSGSNTAWAATGISLVASGGTEARPRNIAMLYCIKA